MEIEKGGRRPLRKWLFTGAAAVPLAAVLITLGVMQPWNSLPGPQSIIARASAALAEIRSYRQVTSRTTTSGGETVTGTSEYLFSAPDNYLIEANSSDSFEKVILIGGDMYFRPREPSWARSVGFSTFSGPSPLSAEYASRTIESILEVRELPGETIDGAECRHYTGLMDIESRMEEAKQAIREAAQSGFPVPDDEELDAQLKAAGDIESEVELWIDENDYFIRQMKTVSRRPDGATSAETITYLDINEPVTIDAPLDAEGNLLPGWYKGKEAGNGPSQPPPPTPESTN